MKQGYCDYRCWFAKGKVCRCWCCGMNHGIGNRLEGLMAELMKDPMIYKYGLTEKQFDFYTAKEDKKAALREIKLAIRKDYKLPEEL